MCFENDVRRRHDQGSESTLDGRGMLPDGLVAPPPRPPPPPPPIERVHDKQVHGPPNNLAKTERNFRAGPNFIPSEFIR